MKRLTLGWVYVLTLGLLPVLLWSATSWQSPNLNVLGRLFGITGLAFLSINIILSARLKMFSTWFHGLDRMYRAHYIIGCVTFILLLLHVDALVLSALDLSLSAANKTLTNFSSLPYILGKLSMVVMTTVMIIILYFRISYKRFILAQRILGALIFFGGYHALFVKTSLLKDSPVVLVYMLGLGFTACAVYLYRSIFHKPLNKRYIYKITQLNHLKDVTEVYMSPMGSPMRFFAGQAAFVSFKSRQVSDEIHPYSMSSGSDDKILRFSIKHIGDHTTSLSKLQVGDEAEIEGPFGTFTFAHIDSSRQVWIAGGIGVTPFLSMARSMPPNVRADLYYCADTPDEAVYVNEIEQIAAKNHKLRLIPLYTDKSGFITADYVIKNSPGFHNVLLCGPPIMMKKLARQFVTRGVKRSNIHFEEFSLT